MTDALTHRPPPASTLQRTTGATKLRSQPSEPSQTAFMCASFASSLPSRPLTLSLPALTPSKSPARAALKQRNLSHTVSQVGGGITAETAQQYLDAGASHVIITSYVFRDGKIDEDNLKKLASSR